MQTLYACYVTTWGKEWDYPLYVSYSENDCVRGFAEWLSGLTSEGGSCVYKAASYRVIPVDVAPAATETPVDGDAEKAGK